MNKHLQQTFFVSRWVLPLLVFSCLFTFTDFVRAETNITSSVHITANGGENSATVKTIINGEVIEDWSTTSTEPIVYSKSINSSSTTTEISTTPSQTMNRDQMKALIAKLQALISLYVSLLKY